MNRPITSPWSAVLTSSATITLIPSRLRARVERAGDLVVVGDRDRPEAARLGLGQQHLDRASRSRTSGRCACAGRRRSVAATARRRAHAAVAARCRGGGRRAARRPPRARRRRVTTRTARAAPRGLRARRATQLGLGDQPRRGGWRASATSPGSNCEPVARRRASSSVVDGQRARRRARRRRRSAAHERAGRRPDPLGGEHDDVGPRRAPAPREHRSASTNSTRSRSRRLERRRQRPAAAATRPSRASRASAGARAARAGRSAAPPRSSLGATRAARTGSRRASCCRADVGAGQDHPVVAREVALQQVARRAVAGDARVEPAEQQPRQRPRQLRREQPLGRRVEAADVQRARVAQRDARRARRERLVDVDDVERQRRRAPPRSSARRRPAARRAPAPRRRERQHLADAEHERLAVGPLEQRLARRCGSPGGCRARARSDSDGAMISTRCPRRGQLVGDPRDVVVDLVRDLPGERRHLGDREALVPRRRVYSGRAAAGAALGYGLASSALRLAAGRAAACGRTSR